MIVEINWSKTDIDRLKLHKESFKEFQEIFIRIGAGKIDLSKDECLFVESLRTLIETRDLIDELVEMAEMTELAEMTAEKTANKYPHTMKKNTNGILSN